MRALTEKQRQWLWFVVLCCAGLVGTWALAFFARWLIKAT
jgi:hypothetical protein